MSIKFNGTTIDTVYVNGVRMERVYADGAYAYAALKGNVTLVSAGTATFYPGEEDVNRHLVILSGRFSGSGLPTGPVPTVNGQPCVTITNSVNNGSDDGGRVGVFTFKLPTGTDPVTVANTDVQFCVFRVVGCKNMTVPFASTLTGGAASINVAAPPQGCGFVVNVRNFGAIGAPTGTDADLQFAPGNPAFGANRSLTGGIKTYGASTHMNYAVTFAYDLY